MVQSAAGILDVLEVEWKQAGLDPHSSNVSSDSRNAEKSAEEEGGRWCHGLDVNDILLDGGFSNGSGGRLF